MSVKNVHLQAMQLCKPAVPKVRPAGQIRPEKDFNPPQELYLVF